VDVDRQQEFVLRTLEERDIRFVRLWFTDVLGTLKSVSVAPAELESAFEEGIGIDGSAIEGFARVLRVGHDRDARPDHIPGVPVRVREKKSGESAGFSANLLPVGSAAWADLSNLLRRILSNAAVLEKLDILIGLCCQHLRFYIINIGIRDSFSRARYALPPSHYRERIETICLAYFTYPIVLSSTLLAHVFTIPPHHLLRATQRRSRSIIMPF
jgi:hypothetical protein